LIFLPGIGTNRHGLPCLSRSKAGAKKSILLKLTDGQLEILKIKN